MRKWHGVSQRRVRGGCGAPDGGETKKGRNSRCAPEGSRADRQARATAAIENPAQRFFTIRRLRIWKWIVPFWSSHAGSISSGDVIFEASNPFAT